MEHEQYKVEIRDLEDTPEQVRERMRQELHLLKQQKEKEREDFVKMQRERLFKQNTDEIRQVDVNYKELKNNIERGIQI